MLIIGEKINATRQEIADAIRRRDAQLIAEVASKQANAGADVIDVNVGSGESDASVEIENIRWVVGVVQGAVDKPLAIDSDNPEVITAGLETVTGPKPWINSVTAEPERLERILPLVEKYGGSVVALCMDQNGIPHDMEGRVKSAGLILEAGKKIGIEPGQFYIDPLVMPVGTDKNAGIIVLESIREIKKQFPGVKTVVGLSNVSFGLPLRQTLNFSFLVLCMGAGLDAAILDPTNDNTVMVLRAADALLGNDDFCSKYIGQYRKTKK